MKYYELVVKNYYKKDEVIGVCSEDSLLHSLKEDKVLMVGEITKEEFHSYGDSPWVKPKFRNPFKVRIVESVEFTNYVHP
jgi:hypothetical protein